MKPVRLPAAVMGASILVFMVSTVGMLLKIEPFHTWYYSLAWWPYIFAVQSFLRLRGGRALLYSDPRRFLLLAFMSVPMWLIFEVYNFRLDNWHYLNLPAEALVRRAGYFCAFATVVPGLLTTRDLLGYFRVFSSRRVRPLQDGSRWYSVCYALGAVMGLTPLIWPRYCFPLVWGGVVFLLEPYVHRHGGRSFLADWERGDPVRFLRVLAAGAICGGLWEMWNFLAGAKWIYTVPFVGELKLFEMPIAGFLGFPPFAVECMVMVAALDVFLRQMPSGVRRHPRLLQAGLLGAIFVFDLLVFMGIDHFTVLNFARGGG